MTGTTMRLAEYTRAFEALYQAVEENEGVMTPEMEQAHDVLQIDCREKVDGYLIRLKAFEHRIAEAQEMEKSFAAKRKRMEQHVEGLELRVRTHMEALGVDELPGDVTTGFKLQNAGGTQGLEILLEDAREWPISYQVRTLSLDTAKVREAVTPNGEFYLQAGPEGEQVLAARLKPRGKVLRRYV